MSVANGQAPPRSMESEKALLGAIILEPSKLTLAAERLRVEDFFSGFNQEIFAAMLFLDRQEMTTEPTAIYDHLDSIGKLEKAGGVEYVASLTNAAMYATEKSFATYIKSIKKKSSLRALAGLGEELREKAMAAIDTAEVYEHLDPRLGAIRDDEGAEPSTLRMKEAIKQSAPLIQRIMSGSEAVIGAPTGYSALDHITAGWIPGEITVLAARPSVGKTALCLEFVLRQAKQGRPSAIFSLEMSTSSLLLRLVCNLARVDGHKLRTGFLSQEEKIRINLALSELAELPILFDDQPSISAYQLRWRIRSLAQRRKIEFVVVDYLQLLRAKGENRTQQVTAISIELKAAARELGKITGGNLLAVSQLSRIGAQEQPQLHHLRESGQIEQDADVVLLLSDEKDTELGREAPSAKVLHVAKQRNGPTGYVKFTFLPRWMGLGELDWESDSRIASVL